MFDQCDTPSHIPKWIKTEISHLLDKVKRRMSSESHKDKLRDVLLKAAMGDTLTEMDELFAIHTEFFYVDESVGVHLIFPRRFMIPHLYESVRVSGLSFMNFIFTQADVSHNTRTHSSTSSTIS